MPSVAAIRDLIKSSRGYVIKPSFTRFSNEVYLAPDGRMPGCDLVALARGRDLIVQAFEPGQQICTYSLVKNGHILAHSSYRTRYTAGRGATIHFCQEQHSGSRVWVEKFVKHLGFTGQIGFDFIETEHGEAIPIECNPRLTSGIHLIGDCDLLNLLESVPEKSGEPLPHKGPSMISFAMMLYGLPAALKNGYGLRDFCQTYLRSRDLIFSLRDPIPALMQFAVFLQFALIALYHGLNPIEATTADIQWEG